MGIVKERSIAILKCAGLIPSLEVEVAERWRVQKRKKGRGALSKPIRLMNCCCIKGSQRVSSKCVRYACIGDTTRQ